jgi:predicted ATPase
MTPSGGGEVPAVRIDADNEWAWCGERRLALTPKAFAVLRRLVDHPNRLVTKDDLLAEVWRDAVVSDAALASCIRDLRRALQDSSGRPRYIQTVHRRGFRFIGPIAGPAAAAGAAGVPAAVPPPSGPIAPGPAPALLVGRDASLARLRDRMTRAMSGHRQLVFVTGEPGIGKTTLVEAFVATVAAAHAARVGRGQCVEQYGAGEPYLPVLEALGRLGRVTGGEHVLRTLARHAPTWMAQLPGLLADEDLDGVRRRAQGATRDRMLREIVEALEALTADAPLVLLLEDLHWSDTATIELLAMLARRPDAARLLVIGTYRPADVAAAAHPLRWAKQELELHGHCEEIELDFLDAAAVGQYLARRFPGHGFPGQLARVLHRCTDGNPLFLVAAIDDLIGQGQLREVGGQWRLAAPVDAIALEAPDTLWHLVEKQAERLTGDEQTVLAVASVAGVEFSAAALSAGGIDPHDGESRCQALARRGQFLRSAGVAEWPDGTVAERYAFVHALYQQVLYARVPAGLRVGLHLRTGERLQRGYGERAEEVSAELAMHFEQGRDPERAVRYRRQAGERALRRHAYREAADHATRALGLLRTLPESPERTQQELALQVVLGSALTATHGYGAAEVARPYERARELCAQVGDTGQLLPVLLGLGRFHQSRGELRIARDLAARLLAIADSTRDAAIELAAHNALGIMAFHGGEFATALVHLERGIRIYDGDRHSPTRSAVFRAGQDPGVSCAVYAAWTLQILGHPERASARMREALERARALDHPFSLAYVCHFAAGFHLCRGERDAVQALEDDALAVSTEHGFRLFPVMGEIHRGGALRGREGLARIRHGLAALRAIGIEMRRPAFLALSAEVCAEIEQPDEGLAAVAEAQTVAERTGQRCWDAELSRLKGALTLRSTAAGAGPAAEAEACFREAIEIARRQRARSFELRAACGLSRLWADRGMPKEARALLLRIYESFTEGLETPDLVEAKALLDDLGDRPGRKSPAAATRSRPAAPGPG